MRAMTHPSLSDAILLTLAAWLIALPPARGREDTTLPQLKAHTFTLASIDTNFTVTGDASGANYFEASLLDPAGIGRQSASCRKIQKNAWVRQTENSF